MLGGNGEGRIGKGGKWGGGEGDREKGEEGVGMGKGRGGLW